MMNNEPGNIVTKNSRAAFDTRQSSLPSILFSMGGVEATLTFLAADQPMTKSFHLNEQGKIAKQDYQNAYLYTSHPLVVNDIERLARVIRDNAHINKVALIRGCDPAGRKKISTRTNAEFPEHPEGTPWVMLDIDGITVPPGMSTISQEAVEWLIREKLPEPFKITKCFYQFSSSAGICEPDGILLKNGLRVHLFYFLDRRIPGKKLDSYLSLHCLKSGFFEKTFDKGGTPIIKLGIDPATIRSSVQVHYFALPIVGKGVVSLLTPEQRFGWVNPSGQDVVRLPLLSNAIENDFASVKSKIVTDWKMANGYQERTQIISTRDGIALTSYFGSTNPASIRVGRKLVGHKLSADGKQVILRFSDENTPWSWYVLKAIPQIAFRFGDSERVPLKELSSSAHIFVRDTLDWFAEIPHQHLSLTNEGYVPAFDFAQARHSLIISPTGSGKTTQVIHYIRSHMNASVVIYVAQTIPLVNQMNEDLIGKKIRAVHYRDVYPSMELSSGVVITTNESLHKVMGVLTPNATYHLIVDEIHRALDDFQGTTAKQKLFESVINGARKVLYMSGTFTPVQRTMLASTIQKIHSGRMDQSAYCCYEFGSVQTYPLYLVESYLFDVDVIHLLKKYQTMKVHGETIPRTILLMDTSAMEIFRKLIDAYELTDFSVIVSRPESFDEEVEAARRSNARILISSPLFSIGLNFAVEPEVLWCKIAYLDIDTSQIIQTINRGNRGEVPCETRLYYSSIDEEPLKFPPDKALRKSMSEILLSECDYQNDSFDMPQLITRVSYQEKRRIEKSSAKAMGELVRSNGFQNHVLASVIRDFALTREVKDEAKAVFKAARAAAKNVYVEMAEVYLPFYRGRRPSQIMRDYAYLSMERKNNFRSPEPRLERDIEAEEIAINMGFIGCDYGTAKNIDVKILRVLWGDLPPWLSERYRPESYASTNAVYTEKLEYIVHFVSQINQWKRSDITLSDLAGKLTQDKQFGKAYLALVSNPAMFFMRHKQLIGLWEEAARLRAKGGRQHRQEFEKYRLEILVDWLATIGIFFEKKNIAVGGRTYSRPDYDKPIFPTKWDYGEIELNLRRFTETVKSVPSEVKFPVREVDFPEKCGKISRCHGCACFHDVVCYAGHGIDWTEIGIGDPIYDEANDCNSFKKAKVSRTLPQ